MCVAIYKPIGSELPTREDLYNCYLRNKDGAGYAFFRNGKIHIKKGYMNFESFYSDFKNEKFDKNENVFIHFRIATHGLVDGGNTHPFPLTDDFSKMRDTELTYNGKCLIHNGIFHYNDAFIKSYSKIISDTMLFSRLLFEKIKYSSNIILEKPIDKLDLEESVARAIIDNQAKLNFDLIKQINSKLSFSKIAIMNEDGSVIYYGNWLNHNGVFYSNSSYEGYKKISFNNYSYYDDNHNQMQKFYNTIWGKQNKEGSIHQYCDFCGQYRKNCYTMDDLYICKQCIKDYEYEYCTICKTWLNKHYMKDRYICKSCFSEDYDNFKNNDYDDNETDICICCGQNYLKSEESEENNVCKKCFKEYCFI